MGKRRSSRELALKFLYQSELNVGNIDEQMKLFLERNSSQDEVDTFMKKLVVSTLKQIKEIDEIIQKFSDNWVIDRMTIIDRNILRMGTCELMFNFSTPPKVAILLVTHQNQHAAPSAKHGYKVLCTKPSFSKEVNLSISRFSITSCNKAKAFLRLSKRCCHLISLLSIILYIKLYNYIYIIYIICNITYIQIIILIILIYIYN